MSMDRQLSELVSKFQSESGKTSPGENIELEVRLKDVTKDMFETIGGFLKTKYGDGKLECTVNAVSDNAFEISTRDRADETRYIRTTKFNGTKSMETSYSRKIRLMRPVTISGLRKSIVSIAKEVQSSKHTTGLEALIRFKARLSHEIEVAGIRWRVDLTAVRSGKLVTLDTQIKDIRDALFGKLTAANYLQDLNHDFIDNYEIEIEYISGDIRPENIISVTSEIYSMLGNDLADEVGYQEEIYYIAKNIMTTGAEMYKNPSHRLKKLSNQAIVISKNEYYYSSGVFPPVGYYLTEKADGERAVLSQHDGKLHIIYSAKQTTVPCGAGVNICDSEALPNGKFAVFDVLVCDGVNVSELPFSERVALINKVVLLINLPNVYEKTYTVITEDLESSFKKVWNADYEYPLDGLIMTTPDQSYFKTINYKWKDFQHSTIDFCAVKCPQKLLGIKPFETKVGQVLYILSVGINHQLRERLGMGFLPHYRSLFDHSGAYYPIQFSPSAAPLAYLYWHPEGEDLHQKIIELGVNDKLEWVFHRVRNDRQLEKTYFGNDFRIAELTYSNYIDPFNFEDLYKQSDSYFTKSQSSASNKYRRFVISTIMRDNLSNATWVIDAAAGRGADLHRMGEIGVENALFIDIDPAAISELIRRKFSFFKGKKGGAGEDADVKLVMMYDCAHDIEYDKLIVKDHKALTVHTMVASLKTPAIELIASTFQYGLNCGMVDGVICNFALHYMCDTVENIRNILLFFVRMLKVGGVFMFTVLNGKKVFELLKGLKRGESWSAGDKYKITRNYQGNTLAPAGQNISVLLNTISDDMYEEPLCNIDTVVSEAKKLGFALELNESMATHMDRFTKAHRAIAENIDENDRIFNELYSYVTLRKVKELAVKKK